MSVFRAERFHPSPPTLTNDGNHAPSLSQITQHGAIALAEEQGLEAKMIMHDRDTKFSSAIDELLKEELDMEVKKSPHRAPNTNAFVERMIQTLQQECLDHFIVFGEQHMNHIVTEFLEHYHLERPHQSMENEPLVKIAEASSDDGAVQCRERLGGLLRHYYRAA